MTEDRITKTRPKRIVCAVRGGPESRATITKAIELAIENQARLTFFHVVDVEFLGQTPTLVPLPVVYNELNEMAKFAMLILLDRAKRRGVQEVDYLVRKGNIRLQLVRYAKQTSAEIMVIGRPTRSPGKNIFKRDEYEGFLAELEGASGIQVITVTPQPPRK